MTDSSDFQGLPRPDRPSSKPSHDQHGKRQGGSRPWEKPAHYPKQHRNAGGDFIMGWHPVQEAVASGKALQRVLIQRDEKGERTTELMQTLRALEIPVQRVPKQRLDGITRKTHQGIVAFTSPVTFEPLSEVVMRAFEAGESPCIVAVDGVTDVRNIGAIARSAEAFGATALLMPTTGVAPIQEDAIKSSSGALLRLTVCRAPRLKDALKELRGLGIQLIALSEKGAEDIETGDLARPLCIVLGDEESGVSQEILALCDQTLKIPMIGKTGSLNVSVSAGIALHSMHLHNSRR